jgi:tripeptidyl-peptidase I
MSGGYKGKLQCGVYKPARVISISYGGAEIDLPERYQKRQCNEIMKLVLQGHSILTASGDYGVASFPGDDSPSGCLSGHGQNQTIYNPDYLSSCPYITSVGATQLYDDQTVLNKESVMQDDLGPGAELFSSTGGFSNRYGVADYQKKAVADYFARHDPGLPYYVAGPNGSNIGANSGVYNRAGRAFPDIRYVCSAVRAPTIVNRRS